jgi:activator of HSP90 ATPase
MQHSTLRRSLALKLAGLPVAWVALRSAAAETQTTAAPVEEYGVTHSAAAIRQLNEVVAPLSEVYAVLTDAGQFDQMMRYAAARRMAEGPHALPTLISTEPGGSFSLFGGYITGRQIELKPNERIVQAWRAASWAEGAYSIVTMNFSSANGTTGIALDHRGFPDEQAPHLAKGWQLNYWQPLARYFARGPKIKGETPDRSPRAGAEERPSDPG